ncbi:MAG: serine esterase, partial [Proteobacteria bacterium]
YAWFHVRFTEQGPVHNWGEAKQNFILLEEALLEISKKYNIPLDHVAVFGFSQGAIMTIGLALSSNLKLETYVAASGRTLQEFAQFSKESPLPDYSNRKIFVSHGVQDSKLPITLGRNSQDVLKNAGLNLHYKEYSADHGISTEMSTDYKSWLSAK